MPKYNYNFKFKLGKTILYEHKNISCRELKKKMTKYLKEFYNYDIKFNHSTIYLLNNKKYINQIVKLSCEIEKIEPYYIQRYKMIEEIKRLEKECEP